MRGLALAVVAVPLNAKPAGAQAPAHSSAKSVSGQLIVGFKKNVSASRQRGVLKNLGAKIHKRLAHIRAAAIRPRSGLALSGRRRRLAKHPTVASVGRADGRALVPTAHGLL